MFDPAHSSTQPPLDPIEPQPPKQKAKRKKVSQACVFCRRSHMTCDDGRPCQRCIRRKIAHLCSDDVPPKKPDGGNSVSASPATPIVGSSQQTPIQNLYAAPMTAFTTNQPDQSAYLQNSGILGNGTSSGIPSGGPGPGNMFPPLFNGDSMGNELTIISEFLASLETPTVDISSQLAAAAAAAAATASNNNHRTPNNNNNSSPLNNNIPSSSAPANQRVTRASSVSNSSVTSETRKAAAAAQPESLSSTERFVLTAADPMTVGTNEDRLNQVISAKFEAGLLKPYNYINSYKKLNSWMETHMSPENRTRILNVMGLFRPRFQWVAQRLTDMDLVLVEEAFERMLLEYDRVFSSMGIPSCLWRRTGEIWKCNKEFAELVGLSMEELKEGRLSIYELMSEESAVNYWEKYGNIAFDAGQKAILTSCILKKPDEDGVSAAERTLREGVSCCFSFTIRRDRYSIPIIIAGNFLPVME
ncbi:hypothetical protein BCR33DRAFT_714063 [Rhizoclosmatium globosum]|uniref:Zn(2)-C6 fungal-type domain-containing protein n=1 Tax=Rhizoclosmatium globosum TaxID=329046 RepID=A0A1Y2CPR3_9FUNG|nr:hypothetical protein BCR33DRAFT_714063 [Rhizoclosmatium globosum]|eukprot:ORY48973.1 hypothetical protein BCR33DRAFT_714063 [Rhizoclosmatium globosum]